MTAASHGNYQSILSTPSTPTRQVLQIRSLSVPSLTLYDEKKLDDFRAREEQKEADFNKQPIVSEEKVEEEQPEDDEGLVEMKDKILEASLAFVSSDGWTRQAIVKGAELAGFPGTVHGMFPKGGIELINFYYLKCNNDLVTLMKEKVGENSEKVGDPKEFVCWALKERLMMLEPHTRSWPQALAMMTLPPNVPKSLANVLTLVDDICFYSGDRSVDVSRVTLSEKTDDLNCFHFSSIGMHDESDLRQSTKQLSSTCSKIHLLSMQAPGLSSRGE